MNPLAWLPWQAYAIAGALALGVVGKCQIEQQAYRRGVDAQQKQQEQDHEKAQQRAKRELDRLRGGDDSRVREFDRAD